jgi:hypothetical protein
MKREHRQSANLSPPRGSTSSLGLSTAVLPVATVTRLRGLSSDLKTLCYFVFYRDNGVATPRSRGPTDHLIYISFRNPKTA